MRRYVPPGATGCSNRDGAGEVCDVSGASGAGGVSFAGGASTNSATSAPVSPTSEFDSYMVMTFPSDPSPVADTPTRSPGRHSIDVEKDQRADDRADDPGRLERALVEVLPE